ncbi:hypothetical protein CRYUN_Cryun06bG0125900 [Craigia yunnanensis]
MIKVLKGIPCATFSIDANGLARVSGNIDPDKTLKLLEKAGKNAQLYWIDSGTNQPSGRRDHHHHFDDPGGRYWQANRQYYQPYSLPPANYGIYPKPLKPHKTVVYVGARLAFNPYPYELAASIHHSKLGNRWLAY